MKRSTPETGLIFGTEESGLASAHSHPQISNTSRIQEELKILFSNTKKVQKTKQAEVSFSFRLFFQKPNSIIC